jgi:Ring finger domain
MPNYGLYVPDMSKPKLMSDLELDLAEVPCYVGFPRPRPGERALLATVPILTRAGEAEEACLWCCETLGPKTPCRLLPCGHKFHKPCIDTWMAECNAVCPLCRESFYHLKHPRLIILSSQHPSLSVSSRAGVGSSASAYRSSGTETPILMHRT